MNQEQIPYSQLRNKARKPLGDFLPLKAPFSIYLEPSNLCNFKCVQCPTSYPDYKDIIGYRKNMDIELYSKIIQDIKAMGQKLKGLRLYLNGEPLLNKNIAKMIKITADNDIADRIEMTTNASLLNEQISQEIIKSGLTYLRISIYSIYDKRNFEITSSKISADQIYTNIKHFRKLRDEMRSDFPFLNVKMLDTFSEENDEFKALYKNIADEVCIESPHNWNGYLERNPINNLYPDKTIHNNSLFPYKKEVCPFPFYSLVITSDGDVAACCIDWNIKTKVGNIKEESLSDIWFGQELRELRKLHIERKRFKNESCQNCTFLYTAPDNIDDLSGEKYQEILDCKKH